MNSAKAASERAVGSNILRNGWCMFKVPSRYKLRAEALPISSISDTVFAKSHAVTIPSALVKLLKNNGNV